MNCVNLLPCLLGLSVSFLVCNVLALEGEGIIGGDDADQGQFPYQVSLQLNGLHICGGGIIADKFVLTAAHCIITEDNKFRNEPFKVVAGRTDLKSTGGAEVDVDKVYVLNIFVRPHWTNDIAILQLKQGLGLGSNPALNKLELPTTAETYAGKTAVIAGYGWDWVRVVTHPKTKEKQEIGGKANNILKHAQVKIISNTECEKKNIHDWISLSQICGQVLQSDSNKPEGVCRGDSGGPLVYGNTVIGLVSTSPLGCTESKETGIYVRVSSFVQIIRDIMSGKVPNYVRVLNIRP